MGGQSAILNMADQNRHLRGIGPFEKAEAFPGTPGDLASRKPNHGIDQILQSGSRAAGSQTSSLFFSGASGGRVAGHLPFGFRMPRNRKHEHERNSQLPGSHRRNGKGSPPSRSSDAAKRTVCIGGGDRLSSVRIHGNAL